MRLVQAVSWVLYLNMQNADLAHFKVRIKAHINARGDVWHQQERSQAKLPDFELAYIFF